MVDFIILYCTFGPSDQFSACEQLYVTPYNVLPPKEDQLFSDAVYLTRLFYFRNSESPCRGACVKPTGASPPSPHLENPFSGEQLQRPLGKSGNTLFLSVQVDIVTFPHSAYQVSFVHTLVNGGQTPV